jgi:hypothetical protein
MGMKDLLDEEPRKGPLRAVTTYRYRVVGGMVYDLLECGHEVLIKAPEHGPRDYRPKRRRCPDCKQTEDNKQGTLF